MRLQIGLIAVVGALVRLPVLVRQPTGYDEDFTAVAVHQPLAPMLGIVSHDSAPPLFYLAERGVVVVAGLLGIAPIDSAGSPAVLRLLPALAGLALVPLIAALARRVNGDQAARWAAAVVAIAPATVLLSSFARMYEPAAALSVAAALLLWRAAERPSPARWAAYLAAAVVACWTAYFAVLAVLGDLVAVLWLRPGRRVGIIAAGLTALAVGSLAPWLIVARAQLEHGSQPFWVSGLSVDVVAGTIGQLFAGPPVDGRLADAPLLGSLQIAASLAGLAGLAALAVAWRRLPGQSRTAAVVCLLASSGVVALGVVSLWRPLLEARYATVMWMPLFALAGAGLARLPRGLGFAALALLAAAATSFGVVVIHPETATIVADVEATAGPNDLVAASWERYLVVLDEASPAIRGRLHVLSAEALPWYVGTAAYPAGAEIHAIPASLVPDGGRIFWVADPDTGPSSLPSGYAMESRQCVTLVCLTVYGPGTAGG